MNLDYQTALKAYTTVQNSKLGETRKTLYKAAVHYATIRSEWEFLDREDRMDQDPGRTAAHNRFIDCCNTFVREQSRIGEDNTWYNNINHDRQLIGDWACYLHCFIGIENR